MKPNQYLIDNETYHLWSGKGTLCLRLLSGQIESKHGNRMLCSACKVVANPDRPKPKMTRHPRIYLNVPFADKDEAKFMGAKWDADRRSWFITIGSILNGDTTPFERWMPEMQAA